MCDQLRSYSVLGMSRTMPLSAGGQLGILWLHETRTRKELRWTIIGVALVIVGAVLAGVAKTLDVA